MSLPNGAVSGYTAANVRTWMDTYLATVTPAPPSVLCNIGTNDVPGLPAEATWKADYTYIIDAILTKFPATNVYLVKPWRRGSTVECATMAGWIDDILATYATNVFIGHDENVWLEGGDDGITMTVDSTHYSTAGHAECVSQWQAILPDW